ncbi:RICIN domain-containing protein [Saccharothrix syringae]|uniref:Ricin B lectin domain-containing protein n=1 Tax=Saccharothrix syringae TaxID=103733 RepID=A0A5Q0H2A4_SACSY|nr:RICIN domain-containing protein [Saccharothrix syringae]QFZ19822.1 hypothetical protein EKG83_22465 [Saccharothrix syringae]
MTRTRRKATLLGFLLLIVSALPAAPAASADTGRSTASTVTPLSSTANVYTGLYPNRQLQARGLNNGDRVEQWEYTGSLSQLWFFGDDGTIRPGGNIGKCLDGDPRQGLGGQVYLWDCNGATWQIWHRYQDGFRNLYSGRCLDANPLTNWNGGDVYQWDCNNTVQQHWFYGRGR